MLTDHVSDTFQTLSGNGFPDFESGPPEAETSFNLPNPDQGEPGDPDEDARALPLALCQLPLPLDRLVRAPTAEPTAPVAVAPVAPADWGKFPWLPRHTKLVAYPGVFYDRKAGRVTRVKYRDRPEPISSEEWAVDPLDKIFPYEDEPVGDDGAPEPSRRSRPGTYPLYGSWPSRSRASRGYLTPVDLRRIKADAPAERAKPAASWGFYDDDCADGDGRPPFTLPHFGNAPFTPEEQAAVAAFLRGCASGEERTQKLPRGRRPRLDGPMGPRYRISADAATVVEDGYDFDPGATTKDVLTEFGAPPELRDRPEWPEKPPRIPSADGKPGMSAWPRKPGGSPPRTPGGCPEKAAMLAESYQILHTGCNLAGRSYHELPRCLVCDSLFVARRPDAKTCSDRCRKALSRGAAPPLRMRIVSNRDKVTGPEKGSARISATLEPYTA